ncbi:hypothetical protein ACKWTF_010089 [Chironomus riparius]
MNPEENFENQSISRLATKKQSLDDMYSAPANFLEIDVINPQTTIVAGKKKFTDYEIRMRTNLPVFKVKESSVRRRYSDFEWLRNELERDSKFRLFHQKLGNGKSHLEEMTEFLRNNLLKIVVKD